jgi:hypothetical protein
MPQFDPYQMIARRLSKDQFDHRDLTIVTEFLVDDIERLIGPRLTDHAYEFTGIYFASTHPRMEYREDGFKHLTRIRLASGSSKDPGSALWQLAHECVHLITPAPKGSTILEEGVACWYQERWVDKIPQVFPKWVKTRRNSGYFPSYDEAYSLVDALMTKDADIVKRLRFNEPVISKISADLLTQEAPWLNKAVAHKLAKQFKRGRPRRVRPRSTSIASSKEAHKTEANVPSPSIFDFRASEIGRQAARLHIGMGLISERLAKFEISEDEIYGAFAETYDSKVLKLECVEKCSESCLDGD